MEAKQELNVVRASKEVLQTFVFPTLDWAYGKNDIELYWTASNEGEGLYVGRLNGENTTFIAVLQYNKEFAYTTAKRSIVVRAMV